MSSRPSILVTRPVPGDALDLLRADADVEVRPLRTAPPRDELLRSVAGRAGLLVVGDRVDDALLDAAGPGLRGIAQFGVGYDNVDVAACTRRGVAVGNTPGVLSGTTAEIAWALILATARRVTEAERLVRADGWGAAGFGALMGVDVGGATLGIVGMGRIGQEVARRALGFRMEVLYSQRTRLDPALERELNATYVPFAELLARSDFVSIHAPATPETRHLMDAAAFARMKPGATFINTSRGTLVDQDALLAALDSGRLRAAGLDVTDPEPIPAGHPLVGRDDVTILPHIGSATHATRARMTEMCVKNLRAALRGERMPWAVDPAVYDRTA